MQNCINPIFTKGRVVKKESLDNLHDFPRELVNLALSEYSDGILYGLSINYHSETIIVSSGAVKYMDEVIIIREETIPFNNYSSQVSIKVCIEPKYITEDFEIIPIQIKVDNKLKISGNEMEIGRFCLSKGATLRKEYTGIKDFRTANNTLDITNVLYAGIKEATMSPKLLKIFAECILKSNTTNNVDLTFAFLCINNSIIQRDCILWYLSKRLNQGFHSLSNIEIYEKLVTILEGSSSKTDKIANTLRKGPSIG